MVQYGFFFDQGRCIDCKACAVACKSWYNLAPGPEKWLRMFEWEEGAFPNVELHSLFAPCYHCENPVCVDAANGAMYKEEKYGAVLIDPAKANSIDLRKANAACPYSAIVFDSDATDAKASMCTMCIDRLEQGLQPLCVASCYMRALDFGPLDEMKKKYGESRDLPGLPSSSIASPAIIFKPRKERQKFVTYDSNKAIQLMAKRDPFPPLYEDASAVTELPDGLVGRSKLVLRPVNNKQLMEATQNDEG
jgi:anaerobic dimethyl sulfoxide reductase subunit B (iron-sulfur subunit)